MTLTLTLELTEEQAEALIAWPDNLYPYCTEYDVSKIQISLRDAHLIEAVTGSCVYRLTDLGKQARAKLLSDSQDAPAQESTLLGFKATNRVVADKEEW